MFTEAIFAETSKKVIALFHSQKKRVLKHTQKQSNDIFPNPFVNSFGSDFRYAEFKFSSGIAFHFVQNVQTFPN